MQSAKHKVKTCVKEYIRLFPQEYDAFLNSVRVKVNKAENKWASTKKTDMLERHVIDMPEVLYFSIHNLLTEEEEDWLYSRNAYQKNFAGMNWFCKTFPEFKITENF